MTLSTTPYIKVDGLSMKTPLGQVYDKASFTVKRGEVVALFGSEGSGKTAMLLTLAGRMKPSSGIASVAGYNLQKDYKKVRKISNVTIIERVNDVPQNSRVDDIVSAELQVVGKPSRKSAAIKFLQSWGLEHLSGTKFCDLEAFERKIYDIALACAGEPELLLVDDIQEGLTQHQSITLMKDLKTIAKTRGVTIVVGVLEYDIARYADAVVVFSPSAERQRQTILKERDMGCDCVICGTGNDVVLDGYNGESYFSKRGEL